SKQGSPQVEEGSMLSTSGKKMKIRKALFVLALTGSLHSHAADVSCTGNVTWVMGDHANCIDDNGKKQLAFKISGSDSWLCNNSDTASSLVLSAKIAEKRIVVYINSDTGTTCENRQSYTKHR